MGTTLSAPYDAEAQKVPVLGKTVIPDAVITLAGARNVFSDCDGDFKQVGWEDVIARDPDWIQLGVRNQGSPAADTKAFDAAENWLKSNPATRGLTAVRENHFLRIGSEQTTIAGVTDADTVQEIARTLYPGKVSEWHSPLPGGDRRRRDPPVRRIPGSPAPEPPDCSPSHWSWHSPPASPSARPPSHRRRCGRWSAAGSPEGHLGREPTT